MLDAKTYTANLHAANAGGSTGAGLQWELEYAFSTEFGMSDLSAASFEALHVQFAQENSSLWRKYKGQGDGSLYCKAYNSSTAPFPPADPCSSCEGSCKELWLHTLNGTNVPP